MRRAEEARDLAGTENAGEASEPPRRMATKNDANGDPLCVPCLDRRRAIRNAAFFDRKPQAPSPAEPTQPPAPVLRIASAVRIPRPAVTAPRKKKAEPRKPAKRLSRKADSPQGRRSGKAVKQRGRKRTPSYVDSRRSRTRASATAAARAKSAKQKAATKAKASNRRPKSADRALERRFLTLVVEIGLLRARVLLDTARGVARG